MVRSSRKHCVSNHEAELGASSFETPTAHKRALLTPQGLAENLFNKIWHCFQLVVPGLVPGIHVFTDVGEERRGWPGLVPAMTKKDEGITRRSPLRHRDGLGVGGRDGG